MATSTEWRKTACILCSENCGLEVKTDRGSIVAIRGDREHHESQGYLCQKAARLDYYQNHADRLDSPLKRMAQGKFEVAFAVLGVEGQLTLPAHPAEVVGDVSLEVVKTCRVRDLTSGGLEQRLPTGSIIGRAQYTEHSLLLLNPRGASIGSNAYS